MTDTVETFQGRVKWFNPKAGFGFITLLDKNESEDVFVHHSGLTPKNECFKTLYQGEYVSLSLRTDDDGKQFANNVTGIGGNELMCERFLEQNEGDREDSNWSTVRGRRDDRGGGRGGRGGGRGGGGRGRTGGPRSGGGRGGPRQGGQRESTDE